jgi:hypothetical protein
MIEDTINRLVKLENKHHAKMVRVREMTHRFYQLLSLSRTMIMAHSRQNGIGFLKLPDGYDENVGYTLFMYDKGMADKSFMQDPVVKRLGECYVEAHKISRDSSYGNILWDINSLLRSICKRRMKESTYNSLLDGTHDIYKKFEEYKSKNKNTEEIEDIPDIDDGCNETGVIELEL